MLNYYGVKAICSGQYFLLKKAIKLKIKILVKKNKKNKTTLYLHFPRKLYFYSAYLY